ncbi:class I SAM-dependent methyltransferase [Luteimonas sp. MC1825]|uniref:SAM-dependent methyltransferase n=1 Tax=Luteimonas sp. MC1825 TaxID=2761107 RepID=UPI00161FEDD2|nr:class I SAM-dependent methyltransferase [Luteimonas sp. MC1825]MBB6599991.1 class I SAM-dependent methyltransferase [Luteimonas sp. MC1825]QOC87695.1 class I SAM-dependent methyltransferase [Luteimonas sp. MC1825]
MKIGPAVRRLMPAGLERKAAAAYRRVFVDLHKVAALVAGALPADAHLLDIGGGDGELLNHLLAARPDVRVTMVDIAGSVGKFVEPVHFDRVRRLPGTSIEAHLGQLDAPYDAALVSDVMHHLPVAYRAQFLRSIRDALRPSGALFVKDIEPGHPVAWLSLVCDKYVSGDRGVTLVSLAELLALAEAELAPQAAGEIGLHRVDRPNYLVRLDLQGPEVPA